VTCRADSGAGPADQSRITPAPEGFPDALTRGEGAWSAALADVELAAEELLEVAEPEGSTEYLEHYVRVVVAAQRLTERLAQLSLRSAALERFEEYPQVA
jgi:hypothetical protein